MGWQPARAITVIAGAPPGCGLDRAARALAEALASAQVLPVPVKVVNVAGDSGRRAWSTLAERTADPHVLCVSHSNLATDRLLGISGFDHETDATPLAILLTSSSHSWFAPVHRPSTQPA
jgi:tripartite-type tricarboxylate transporter receptor subunit TctC